MTSRDADCRCNSRSKRALDLKAFEFHETEAPEHVRANIVKACELHEANASKHVRLCIREIALDSINAFCIIFLAVLQIHSFIRRPCQRSRSTYTCPKPGDATKHLVCLHLYFMFSLLKGKRFHIAITTLKYHYFASQMSASLDINTTIFLFVFAAGVV